MKQQVLFTLKSIGASTETVSFSHWRDSLEAEGQTEELLGNYFSAQYDNLIEEPSPEQYR